ncbi:MAG: PAS domain-containing protein [Ferrovibrio sp.]|uniref:PAS domain-containing protein n=1 Tax=Ferrovibrio sp. TaxID=1917215 RepID=UPI002628BCDA|nr:PAS domain-containing protein [Ferrovibrio sp.]MCW0233624.1 PAS domain-containing protein [Ferrovibrio sp.]
MPDPLSKTAAAHPPAELIWNPEPEDFRAAGSAAVYRYWLDQRHGRRFPGRADIDPLAMRGALGNIALIEVQHDPQRFRIRLAGTYQAQRLGFDPTGMWLDELPAPEYRQLLIDRLQALLARPEPLLVRNRQLMDDRWYDYETIWLPMASDGDSIDMVMACQIFADAPQGG